jgi:hypothetical protein
VECLPLVRLLGSGVIDQNSPHYGGCCSKEMRPTLPINFLQLSQSNIGLVNQSCRLQGVIRSGDLPTTPDLLDQNCQLALSGVAVEKLLPWKMLEKTLRYDAPQTTFSILLYIFYPQFFAFLEKMEFFNSHRAFTLTKRITSETEVACP